MAYEEKDEELYITYDNLFNFNKYDIIENKFNSLTRCQTKAFDATTYEKEKPLIVKNDRGQDTEKNILHKNYIRWRYSKDDITSTADSPDEAETLGIKNRSKKSIETNAKIVEWSDGTFQLAVGDTYFDILISDATNTSLGILDIESDAVIMGKPIVKKMILKVNEDLETDAEFLETNSSSLNSNKVKLSHAFYDATLYIKDEDKNKFSKKGGGKKDDEDLTKKKRNRP